MALHSLHTYEKLLAGILGKPENHLLASTIQEIIDMGKNKQISTEKMINILTIYFLLL